MSASSLLGRVFIGFKNSSGYLPALKAGFEDLGIECFTAVATRSEPGSDEVDFVQEDEVFTAEMYRSSEFSLIFQHVHQSEQRSLVWGATPPSAVRFFDTFVFVGQSFLPDLSDLAELRRMGKRIIFILSRDEVCWEAAVNQEFFEKRIHSLGHGVFPNQHNGPEPFARRIRTIERYADLIVADPAVMQLALRPYLREILPVRLDSIHEKFEQRLKNPRMLSFKHPSIVRGVESLHFAVDRLNWENVSQRVAIEAEVSDEEARRRCLEGDFDILIDNLLLPGVSKRALEFLALGRIVVGNNDPAYHGFGADGSPVIHATVDTIFEVLRSLLSDYPARVAWARKGRPFVANHHSPKAVCERLVRELLEPKRDHLITPTFFRMGYRPQNFAEIPVWNRYTEIVKGCDWYAECVPKGERAELVF